MVLGLTFLAELIFLLILLGLAPELTGKKDVPGPPILVQLIPDVAAKRRAPPKRTVAAKARQAAKPPALHLPTPPVPPIPLAKSPLVELTKEDLAAADISKLGSAASSGSASAGDSVAVMGPGEGPGGARLYNAEWVVEPTDAQLSYYLPKAVEPGSWAMIACKTIDHYHVENCALLGEAPMGSGLARAMRLAAWQFQVRPPRIDGKPLVGAWVKIRIDFTRTAKE